MSRLGSYSRSVWYWFTDHVATGGIIVVSVVLLVLLVLGSSGLFLTPVAPGPPTTTTTTTMPAPVPVATDTSPSATIVASLFSDLHRTAGYVATDPSTAATNPLLSGCTSTVPPSQMTRSVTLGSSTLNVVTTVDVYGAGLGALALANMQSSVTACTGDYVQSSSPNGLDGFIALGPDVAGSQVTEVTWRRGDVLLSLYAFTTNYQSALSSTLALASAIDTQLAPLMSSSCANENAPVSAARRNPTQSNYVPFATHQVVTPPPSVTRPNQNLLYAALPTVPTPTPGSITSAPTAPSVPTVALSTTVTVPESDTVGPGCGWAFTGQVPPPPPATPASLTIAAAITQLESTWTAWPSTVTAYLEAKATYEVDLTSYTATIPTTTTTSTTTTTLRATTTTTSPPPTTSTTSTSLAPQH